MRTTEKLVWFVIGACAGAGVALLYAPQSGKTTRKLIRRKAEETRDSLTETGESVLEAGRGVYRKGMSAVSGAAEGAAGLYSRVRDQVASR
jgi:gas vesicle protein